MYTSEVVFFLTVQSLTIETASYLPGATKLLCIASGSPDLHLLSAVQSLPLPPSTPQLI